MLRLTGLVVVAVALLAGCGPHGPHGCTGACPPQVAATPSPHLDPGFDVLVTDQDRTVSVHVGQRIEVYLVQRQGMKPWENLVADDLAVLKPANTGIVPPPAGATVAGFVAAAPGVAGVTATASPHCEPNEACPAYVMLFSVRVMVT